MDRDTLVDELKAARQRIIKTQRTGNDDGWRLDLANGAIINVYDSGNYSIQGKRQPSVRVLVDKIYTHIATRQLTTREVLVVGRVGKARGRLGDMLKRWGLNPLFVDQLTCSGRTIIEQLQHLHHRVLFAVVLARPDDEGYKKNKPEKKAFRAQQNVVLELGMVLGLLGRSKVVILIKKGISMDRPSNISGLRYITYVGRVTHAKRALAKAMQVQGVPIKGDEM
jgi:predicted nucleotide-binding protein